MTESEFAAAGDAIIAVDAHGTITSWNPAAERLLGHEASAAIGQTLALIVPPQHRARHAGAFHEAMDSGELAHRGQPARIEAQTASGDIIPLVFTLGLLDDRSGQPTGAIAVLRADAEPIAFI